MSGLDKALAWWWGSDPGAELPRRHERTLRAARLLRRDPDGFALTRAGIAALLRHVDELDCST